MSVRNKYPYINHPLLTLYIAKTLNYALSDYYA
jgi:hypothetical protein